jgi:hypothetical protein
MFIRPAEFVHSSTNRGDFQEGVRRPVGARNPEEIHEGGALAELSPSKSVCNVLPNRLGFFSL